MNPIQPSFSPLPINSLEQTISKAQAEKTFWGLGDKFWMQMIDGKFHQYGPMVFDEGLHGREKELGFFNSLKTGCDFAAAHLTEKPTLHFYKELHKKLCAHFTGTYEDQTAMNGQDAGVFRSKFCTTNTILTGKSDISKEMEEHYKNYFAPNYLIFSKLNPENIMREYAKSKPIVENWEAEWETRVNTINAYIMECCEKLGIPQIAILTYTKDRDMRHFGVIYAITSPEEHEKITEKLFDQYNAKIQEAASKEDKLKAIAELFQMLEWLHPFPDGQGRTDLVLLAKLLADEGFNPPILEEPYTSTWTMPEDWLQYLKRGLERWQEARKTV